MIEQEIIRLLVAAGLGAVIGFERERLDRGAGLRTHALVSVASALVMIVSSYGFQDVVTANRTVVLDPSRMAAQVVSGIGFLGAGLIILRKNTVYGLTTAASIWAVAAIGLASGAGLYIAAALTTGLLLLILSGLRPVEQRLFAHKRMTSFVIRFSRQQLPIATIEAGVREAGMDLWRLQLRPGKKANESVVTLELREARPDRLSQLAERLHNLPGVREVSYGRQKRAIQPDETGEAEENGG
jgi:putative Mg2+ transporter-C (MgtC) family protein